MLEMKQERASKFLFYIFEAQISLNSFIFGQLLPLQIFFWIEAISANALELSGT